MIGQVIKPFVFTHKSLEDFLPELTDIPMAFMYGEFDWVAREVADRLIDSEAIQGEVF